MNSGFEKESRKVFQKSLYKIFLSVGIGFAAIILSFFIQSFLMKENNAHLEKNNFLYISFIQLEKLHSDMEAGLRGFIINKNSENLNPYKIASERRNQVVESIYKKLTNDYESLRDFRTLDDAFSRWQGYSKEVIENQKARNNQDGAISPERLKEVPNFEQGRIYFDVLRDKSYELREKTESNILNLREKYAYFEKVSTFVMGGYTLIVVIILSLYLTRFIRDLTHEYQELLSKIEKSLVKLKEASESKDLFLANMSHEIRTPLGAIIGFADLLAKDKQLNTDSDSRSYVSFIKRNSNHLLNLVNDLFDISKIIAKKVDINYEKVDSQKFIDDVKDFFSSKAHDKRINLSFNVSKSFPVYFFSDITRLKQILTNLIGNAIKFTPKKRKIKVIFDYQNNFLVVDVIDEGIGINIDKQQSIFDPFSQADDTHSREFGGAGLGLSISNKLAKLLGGKIELISTKINVGSHFRLTLELKDDASLKTINEEVQGTGAKTSDEEADVKEEPLVSYNFSEKKILLVEDAKENQILFNIYLSSTGAKIDIVDNGSDAVRKVLDNGFYDLILMDIQMPGMDGYEAIQILRNSNYKGAVVALTAHVLKGEKEKCIKLGFDDYLTKPITQPELLGKIHEHFAYPSEFNLNTMDNH